MNAEMAYNIRKLKNHEFDLSKWFGLGNNIIALV